MEYSIEYDVTAAPAAGCDQVSGIWVSPAGSANPVIAFKTGELGLTAVVVVVVDVEPPIAPCYLPRPPGYSTESWRTVSGPAWSFHDTTTVNRL